MAETPWPSDEELMQRAQRGDREAFDELVQRHYRRVYQWAGRFTPYLETAEEWTQEVFLRLFEHRHAYDPQRPFLAWLRRVAVNYCLNALAAQKEEPLSWEALEETLGNGGTPPDPTPLPEEMLEREETLAQVREAISRLPPRYRAVVLLRYYEELPYEAIAETLNLPLGTVKTHLHRARAILRRELERTWGEERPWEIL